MKVSRKVDTVFVEMDINTAEKVLEVLNQVADWIDLGYGSDIHLLSEALQYDGDVRAPSPLYIAETQDGRLALRRTTQKEMERRSATL